MDVYEIESMSESGRQIGATCQVFEDLFFFFIYEFYSWLCYIFFG